MNSKIKKVVIFAGLVLVCIGSLSLVLSRANAAQPTAPASNSQSSGEIILGSPDSIAVPPISSSPNSDTGSAFVPSSGVVSSKPLTVVSKPSSQPPKPTPPASSALTNKAKKPSYTTPPKAPASGVSSAKPAYTGNNDPIFGNKHGTGGVTTQDKKTDHDGDINKQIGTMD
jgi:hypothetical protein